MLLTCRETKSIDVYKRTEEIQCNEETLPRQQPSAQASEEENTRNPVRVHVRVHLDTLLRLEIRSDNSAEE